MSIRETYNEWAAQYDTNKNRTRDLEAVALREMVSELVFRTGLEIGCGTGKNSGWLAERVDRLTSVDLSEGMLAVARAKVDAPNVSFVQADIREPWHFSPATVDLVSFSLVLEHLDELDPVFGKASAHLAAGGYLYLGELHPFKQYTGSKARFETENGIREAECYTHHVSDFVQAAKCYGLRLTDIREYFDEENRAAPPRILAMVFHKGGK